ncbi:hypothetical protein MRX96_010332 [Rhipicephalus microplus]
MGLRCAICSRKQAAPKGTEASTEVSCLQFYCDSEQPLQILTISSAERRSSARTVAANIAARAEIVCAPHGRLDTRNLRRHARDEFPPPALRGGQAREKPDLRHLESEPPTAACCCFACGLREDATGRLLRRDRVKSAG